MTLEAAGTQPEFAARYTRREEARRRFGAFADAYARFHLVADPPADALVEAFAGPEGARLRAEFAQALDAAPAPGSADARRGASAPVAAFFDAIDPVPAWVDFDRVNRGARVVQRTGPAMGIVLAGLSLMGGYTSGPGVKPLAWTGQLDKMAPIRLLETGQFIIQVMQIDGLRRGSEGFRATAHVRVGHAAVRRRILASGRWDTAAWGLPINQADMLGTLLMFSHLMLEGARRIGFTFTPDESEAVLHAWRYCGFLSGIDEALLFTCEADARRVTELVQLIDPGPDEDGRALARALRGVPTDVLTTPAGRLVAAGLTRYLDGMTRAFIGDEHADGLAIPNARWKLAAHPTRALFGTYDAVRRAIPGGSALAATLGNGFLKFSNGRSLAAMRRGRAGEVVPGR